MTRLIDPELDGKGYVIVTDNYYIFNRAPTNFDPLPFILGQKGPAECIEYDPSRPGQPIDGMFSCAPACEERV